MILGLLPIDELLVSRIAYLVEVDCLCRSVLLVRLLFLFSRPIVTSPASAVAINIAGAVVGCLVPRVLALPQPAPLAGYLVVSIQGFACSPTALRELPRVVHYFFSVLLLPGGQLQGVHVFLQVVSLLALGILPALEVLVILEIEILQYQIQVIHYIYRAMAHQLGPVGGVQVCLLPIRWPSCVAGVPGATGKMN